MKTCRECGHSGEDKEFPSAGWRNGKQYRRNICMSCYWLHVKKPRRKNLREWYIEFKKGCCCKNCGNNDFRVLEFHHRDRAEKSFEIGLAMSSHMGTKTILGEIEKCDCLCANCHRIVTWEEQNRV